MEYNKTQYGILLNVLLGLIIFFYIFVYIYQIGDKSMPFLVFLIILVVLSSIFVMFYKLRVKIDQAGIHIIYGIGLIHIRIQPQKIESVTIVKNPWYYGLGIRFTPKGMLYNISGADAIELIYKQNGKNKRVRIGSNDCENLQQILKHVYSV